jgi:hypothetical protein
MESGSWVDTMKTRPSPKPKTDGLLAPPPAQQPDNQSAKESSDDVIGNHAPASGKFLTNPDGRRFQGI